MKRHTLLTALLLLAHSIIFGQVMKSALYFDRTTEADTSSTVMIPVLYNEMAISSDKLASWGGHYANIIFYDFTKDSFHKLFAQNTYIEKFGRLNYFTSLEHKNRTARWMFYEVRDTNTSGNKKIDGRDPGSLYASDLQGNQLRRLTPAGENVLTYELFEKQGFMLIKMQRDQDGNGKFNYQDRDFYCISLNLETLKLGSRIDLK